MIMMKSLVAYFSAGGATAEVARKIAGAAEADLYEISPEPPYSTQDIRWTNPFARCNREKFGKLAIRLSGNPENLDGYDLV